MWRWGWCAGCRFAFCLRIEAPSCALLGIVLVICAGVLLTVAGETQFHAVGFVLVMAASFMSG
jgi:solute carrier family 35 protein C2